MFNAYFLHISVTPKTAKKAQSVWSKRKENRFPPAKVKMQMP